MRYSRLERYGPSASHLKSKVHRMDETAGGILLAKELAAVAAMDLIPDDLTSRNAVSQREF